LGFYGELAGELNELRSLSFGLIILVENILEVLVAMMIMVIGSACGPLPLGIGVDKFHSYYKCNYDEETK
jgi:hypothetical protein